MADPTRPLSGKVLDDSVRAAFHGQLPLEDLQRVLLQGRPLFRYLLRDRPPNADESRRLQQASHQEVMLRGVKRRLDPHLVAEAAYLSDKLKISAFVCAELLYDATHKTPFNCAVEMYNEGRQCTLSALVDLLKGRMDEHLDGNIREYFVQYTNELLTEEVEGLLPLPMRILQHIRDLSMKGVEEGETTMLNARNNEAKILAVALFLIYYMVQITPREVDSLLMTLQSVSTRSMAEPRDAHLQHLCNLLLICFVSALAHTDTLLDRDRQVVGPLRLIQDAGAIEQLHRTISSQWAHSGVHAAILLVWSYFLTISLRGEYPKSVGHVLEEGSTTSFNKAVELGGAFEFLSSVLSLRSFTNDENLEFYKEVLDVLTRGVINNMQNYIREIVATEEVQALHVASRGNFEKILKFIADLYKDSDHAWGFLDSCSRFLEFTEGLASSDALFIPYMDMLTSLASGRRGCAERIYQFLSAHAKWDHFFKSLSLLWRDLEDNVGSNIEESEAKCAEAVLRLLQEVLKHDVNMRRIINDNAHWNVLDTLFCFVRCAIPSSVKAEIFKTLACFAMSPDIAKQRVWPKLERTQILQTYVPPGEEVEKGIRADLEEHEPRMKGYPETIGFLELLGELVEKEIPMDLGAGYRVPGIGDYLTFVQEGIFLKHSKRAYAIPSERWKVAAGCLRIFLHLLQVYEPMAEDFQQLKSQAKPPGFELMHNFLSGKQILHELFDIIRAGDILRDEQEGEDVEKAVLLSLQVLETLLSKDVTDSHEGFLDLVRTKGFRSTCASMDVHLQRERHHIVSIATFVTSRNRAIAIHSVEIIARLSTRLDNLVRIFMDAGKELEILSGFMSGLEMDVDDDENEDDSERSEPRSLCLSILRLLLQSMKSKTPNLTQFLLGFNLDFTEDSDLASTAVGSCLGVVLNLVMSTSFSEFHPRLSVLCSELLYSLSASPITSRPIRRYLRSRDYFVYQLSQLSPVINKSHILDQLHQRAWLFKAVALELHVSAAARLTHHHHSQRLMDALFEGASGSASGVPEGIVTEETTMRENIHMEQSCMKLLEQLDAISIPQGELLPPLAPPHLFSHTKLDEFRGGQGFYNVEKLRRYLMEEYERLGIHSTDEQRVRFKDERCHFEESVILFNSEMDLFEAKRMVFLAWAEVVEVAIIEVYTLLRPDGREALLYDILESLLDRLPKPDLLLPIATRMSGVVTVLLAKLREQSLTRDVMGGVYKHRLSVEHCHKILHGLLDSTLRHQTSQEMRGRLYSALINYLQYTRPSISAANSDRQHQEGFTSGNQRYDEDMEAKDEALERSNTVLLDRVADRLMEVLGNDASSGALSPWRALAYGALDVLIAHDRTQKWLEMLALRGFLKLFLEGIPQSVALDFGKQKLLYIYEANMSLFARMASTSGGAKLLLQYGALREFFSWSFLDKRPNMTEHLASDGNSSPSLTLERYYELLAPVLHVVSTLALSLPNNKTVIIQTLEFLSKHHKTLLATLKDRGIGNSPETLRVLSLLTGVITLVVPDMSDGPDCVKPPITTRELFEKLPQYNKYTTHLLNVLVRYWRTAIPEQRAVPGSVDPRVRLCREVCRNALDFARKNQLLFTPDLRGEKERSEPGGARHPLGILRQLLEWSIKYWTTVSQDLEDSLADLSEQQSQEYDDKIAGRRGLRGAQEESYTNKVVAVSQLLHMIETAAVIIFRHVKHYLSDAPPPAGQTGQTGPAIRGIISEKEKDELRKDVVERLLPLFGGLMRLEDSPNARGRFEFAKDIARKVKDLVQDPGVSIVEMS